MNNSHKISSVEAFFLVAYIGLTDIIGLLLVFGGLDDFFILDAITFPVTQLYFRMKGVSRAGLDVATNLGELVPYLGAFPLRTAGVVMVIWTDWHPESIAARTVEKAAVTKPKVKTPVQSAKMIPFPTQATTETIRKAA